MAKAKIIQSHDLPWPETVMVLDPDCGHKLSTKPGANADNDPQSAGGWAEDEFRHIEASTYDIDLMLSIWQYRYHVLNSHRAKYPHTYSEYDVYNGAWAACGYTEQPDSALLLCAERFKQEPNGDILNDPFVKVVKKLVRTGNNEYSEEEVAETTALPKKKVPRKAKRA
jgi:hypothetical protein